MKKVCSVVLSLLISNLIFGQVRTSGEEAIKVEKPAIQMNDDENLVYNIVQQMPEFVGGNIALETYLKNNLRYPAPALDNHIEGIVIVRFNIMKDGSIKDAQILRGIEASCNEEALRLIQNMPKWNAGKHNGKNVHCSYTLPIKFKLN